MTRRLQVSADTIARQKQAANPESSVWVAANAGSGKTHVLTMRVLRLMLRGVPPEQILCLTYTKAAAAEMRARVSDRLAGWSLMDDATLRTALTDIEDRQPDSARMLRARALFADALETPGGLRIMTIHAFCEAILHRFPKEAGVPFDFSVIEDFERGQLIETAREGVLADGLRGIAVADAVDLLFGMLSQDQVDSAIAQGLGAPRRLRDVTADPQAAKRRLRAKFGVGNGPLSADLHTALAEGYPFTAADHAAIFAVVLPDPQGTGFVDQLARIDPERPDPDALCAAFLTKERTARARLLLKGPATLLPDLAERLTAEAGRLEQLMREIGVAELVERSEALLDVLAEISGRYEAAKRARSLLDFDDLIDRVAALLEDQNLGLWVRYKLDAGISHLLVDESQDANGEQWRVVDALTADFYDGESAADRPRTIFTVGDQKQSIFSFQGAEPELFVDAGNRYAALSATVKLRYEKVPLRTSFRTLPKVLEAVDLTFAEGTLPRAGVLAGGDYAGHDTARSEGGGLVTLWPPLQQEPEPVDPDNWPLEAPPAAIQSAARQMAERIAGTVAQWVADGRPMGPRQRPVRPDDVLILVQTRTGPMFREIIRALVRKGLPTPGADRLPITSHIAVLDLMALGDVLLNPADDLQLAALLRSPLFDVSEGDLLEIAHGRTGTLWTSLQRGSNATGSAAFERLDAWRQRLDFDRPFDFYGDVLYRHDGLKRFHARLGPEIDDVMSEFLELAMLHERSAQPSLQGFLASLRARDITIKRELAESAAGVRVMTVHGAKGLEAPIVILADAASKGGSGPGTSVFFGYHDRGPILVHAANKGQHAGASTQFREDADEAEAAEYWRRLYVAMTRAEDELYVTGVLTPSGKLEGTWYEAIDAALRPESESVLDADGSETALIFPRVRATVPPVLGGIASSAATSASYVPLPLPDYRLRRIVRPSSAFAEIAVEDALGTDAEAATGRDPETARQEGVALHALLHHLLKLERAHWPAVMAKALPVLLPDLPESHDRLAAKAESILLREELQSLFGPQSRGEVPILAQGARNGAPITIAGRIDRLVIHPQKVTIIDYKSDAGVPMSPEAAPMAYQTQLGLYALIAGLLFPGHEIEAGILWTGPESLMILPVKLLRKATEGFTIG